MSLWQTSQYIETWWREQCGPSWIIITTSWPFQGKKQRGIINWENSLQWSVPNDYVVILQFSDILLLDGNTGHDLSGTRPHEQGAGVKMKAWRQNNRSRGRSGSNEKWIRRHDKRGDYEGKKSGRLYFAISGSSLKYDALVSPPHFKQKSWKTCPETRLEKQTKCSSQGKTVDFVRLLRRSKL